MEKFNKVSSVKAVGKASLSTKNLKNSQHVNNFSDCDTGKDTIYSNSGKKSVQNGIETEKLFVEQGSSRNTERESKANSKEITSYSANLDCSELQPVLGKKNERHIKTYENKMVTQYTNKGRFKYSERRAVQNISEQSIPNKTLDRKPTFRVQSTYINSNRIENKTYTAYKNSKSYSSIVKESVHQNYKNYAENPVTEKLDVSIAKLNLRESREKQSDDLYLSGEVPAKHSLESDATNYLPKNKGAITKASQYTQTFEQPDDTTSSFVKNIKEQNMHKTEISELKQKKNEILQSDLLNLNEKVSDKNCSKIISNAIEETVGSLKGQKSNDAKANLTNEVKVNDKITENQYSACKPQLKDEAIGNNLEQELQYCRYNNGYLLCRPVTIYPLHTCIPNSTFLQHFGGYSGSDLFYQNFYNGELINESHSSEFPNVMNCYQEQYNKVSADNKQDLGSERNYSPNSNDLMYLPGNLNYAYVPFLMPWCEHGTVYYQYSNFSPVQCSCISSSVQ